MNETPTSAKDEYQITFKNGALAKLKQIAAKLDISEDNLDEVVQKGLKALELPDDDKLIFSKGGERYFVEIKKL